MSSYHLPYRGLPQELLDMIFEYALCKPGGITVKQKDNPDIDLMGVTVPINNIKSNTQGLALGLFSASRHVSAVAQDIFYRNNVFILDINPDEGFEWLRRINARHRRRLQHVHLTRQAVEQFNAHVDVAFVFLNQLWARGPLKTLTIDMPDDFIAGWMWTDNDHECLDSVHSAGFKTAMQAFKDGRVKTVRLAYPHWYALATPTVSFCSVFMTVGSALVDRACGWRALRRHGELLDGCNRWDSRGTTALKLRRVARAERRLFREGGFVAHRGVRRMNEKGTVVVIQRAGDAERSLRLRGEGRERSGILRVRA